MIAPASLRPIRAATIVGLLSIAVNLGIAALMGIPEPHVHDEFSYLLAADTFTHGRLANPPHPCSAHFESIQILQNPNYTSKYPPGQGLVLAAGKITGGHFIVGSWLSVALACVAVSWMLMAWIRPRLALLGGLLAALHPMVVLWGQNYYGGGLPLLGGSLLLGGMRRAVDHPGSRPALLMGLGMGILALTRPYEGVALSLLSLATLAIWSCHRAGLGRFARLAFLLPPMILPVAIALAGLAYYNMQVTGSPTRLPYVVYESQFSNTPLFLFQDRPARTLEFRNREFAQFESEMSRGYDNQRATAIPALIFRSTLLAAKAYFPVLAVFLKDEEQSEGWWEMARCLPLVVLQLPLFIFPCIVFSRAARIPALLLAAFTCALALPTWKNNHYAAPAFGLMLVLTLQSIRLWRRWRFRSWPIGRFVQRITMAAYILWPFLLFIVWPALKSRPHMGHERAALIKQLEFEGGHHLVIVSYAPKHGVHEEWVYNEADIDRARVVWARDLGAEKNRKLLDYFKDRHIWVFNPDQSRVKLVPYPDSPEQNGPAQSFSSSNPPSCPGSPPPRMTAYARRAHPELMVVPDDPPARVVGSYGRTLHPDHELDSRAIHGGHDRLCCLGRVGSAWPGPRFLGIRASVVAASGIRFFSCG